MTRRNQKLPQTGQKPANMTLEEVLASPTREHGVAPPAFSLRFLFVTLISSTMMAYGLGRVTRAFLFENSFSSMIPSKMHQDAMMMNTSKTSSIIGFDPETTTVLANTRNEPSRQHIQDTKSGVCAVDIEEECRNAAAGGHHLIVDMKGVDSEFLNSEIRLSKAIENTCKELPELFTLISHHCHVMVPQGVSCVGLLKEGYIAFHTWPEEGVLTLDIFASPNCGSRDKNMVKHPLIQSGLPKIQQHFGIAVQQRDGTPASGASPNIVWSHRDRGFGRSNTDYKKYVVGNAGLESKEQVASLQMKNHQMDIIDVMTEGSMEGPRKNRMFHLDGVIQSSSFSIAPYYESLVHPAMFAHYKPERVAIVGDSEGATLREVLKHNTVKEAIMVETDEGIVEAATQYLLDWNDCTDLIGVANSCFDDPRVSMLDQNGMSWFMDKLSLIENETHSSNTSVGLLDVVIIDTLDLGSDDPFSEDLYKTVGTLKSIFNSLSQDGVIVMQTGESPDSETPPDGFRQNNNRLELTQHLEAVGFEGVYAYEEAHSGFYGPWSYLVAFKDMETKSRWYFNEAVIAREMHARSVSTVSGLSPFRYFDGGTMLSYQRPHKTFETVFCREQPTPKECDLRGFNLNMPNAPVSSMEVKMSGVGERAGRGVYAKADIANFTYIAAEKSVESVMIEPLTYEMILDLCDDEQPEASELNVVQAYLFGYGFELSPLGLVQCAVDSSFLTFVNHGCNGTYNMGWTDEDQHEEPITEVAPDPEELLHAILQEESDELVYNPAVSRNLGHYMVGSDVSLRHIRAGEEILSSYMEYEAFSEAWPAWVKTLRGWCTGDSVGEVTEYEQDHK